MYRSWRFLLLPFLLVMLLAPASFSTATAAPSRQTLTYYRLRIEFSTTSDWTTLTFENPDSLLAMRVISVEGDPTHVGTQINELAMNQPLSLANQGHEIRLIADYALDADATDQPLEFLLQKGSLNWTRVDVSVIVDGTPHVISQTYHELVSGDTTGLNKLEFTVFLSGLSEFGPREVPLGGSLTGPMVWAFYYPWYSLDDWSSDILRDRPLDPYSSAAQSAMRRHIEQAQSAGIDGFISSWWGPRDPTDQNLARLLDVSQDTDFSVMIYFETMTGDGPLGQEDIHDWLSYFIATYRDDPAYMKIDGKPVIVVWVSFTVPLDVWRDVFTQLHAEGLDAVYLAMGYDNVAALEVFDGLHEYGVFAIPDLAATVQRVGRAVRYYSLLMDPPTPKLWAATVQPGYDDRLIPGREGLVQDRAYGDFYRRTFDIALASDPDWIFISTWNEWWEHTYIEPSESYGTQYLEITREYVDRWKAEWGR